MRGKGEWDVIPDVVDALDEAFYKAFDNVQPSGKRLLLGLDVSGSMREAVVNGIPGLSCSMGAAAMAMVTWKTEKDVVLVAFDTQPRQFGLTRKATLANVYEALNQFGGGTDCAQPVLHAIKNKIPVDTFIIYTDHETWAGSIHPAQAFERYRKAMNIPARLISVGMATNQVSIANPGDGNMLDVVGFDTSTPEIIRAFAAGEL